MDWYNNISDDVRDGEGSQVLGGTFPPPAQSLSLSPTSISPRPLDLVMNVNCLWPKEGVLWRRKQVQVTYFILFWFPVGTLRSAQIFLSEFIFLSPRLMDQMQQEQSTSDTTIQSGQHVQNTHGCQTDHIAPVVSPTGAWGKIPGVSSMQAAGLHSQVSDYVQSELVNAGSTSVLPLNISRPRPTALGNKLAGKTSRIPETYVKEKPSIPAFVTDLHSPISQSLTEPSQLPHSPQSPFSRQPYSVQPYLSPQASLAQPPPNPTPPSSLSPKARLSPQPQKTIGGALVENQPQVDKTCKESEGFK